MSAAYDSYDYAAYWDGRDYEHKSEMIALNALFGSVSKMDSLLDVGSGFGRLSPSYIQKFKKITLADPSRDLLKKAKKHIKSSHVSFVQSTLQNLPKKLSKKFDVVMLVRVMHHIEDADEAITALNKLVKDDGYIILEFANKLHAKALFNKIIRKGDLTFPLEIHPNDRRSPDTKSKRNIAFVNHHPDVIKKLLSEHGFKIIQTRSVSNIRSSKLKKILPFSFLITCERCLQLPFSRLNFGPSLFILAQKTT